eukprot:COSAG01_NODE_44779_length_415_cov_3.996835_1_plen_61_part_10
MIYGVRGIHLLSLPMQHNFEPIERLQFHIDSFLPQFSVRSRKGFFGCLWSRQTQPAPHILG